MSKKPSIAGIILIVLGLVLLLRALHIYIFGFIWPLVFIILGLWLIYRRGQRGDSRSDDPIRQFTSAEVKINIGPTGSSGPTDPSGSAQSAGPTFTHHVGRAPEAPRSLGEKVKFGKFIGDMYVDCNNVNMQNVEVSIFIGDLQVDLRGGKLNPGLNRMIVSGFLGDVIILAPKEMAVFTHCSGFIGDVDLLGKRTSGFGNNVEGQSSTYDTAESKLYIAVNSFIGDIRVYPV